MTEHALSLVGQHDSILAEMLAQARAAVTAGQSTVAVDPQALIGLFADLDACRQREIEAGRPRPRIVPCMRCGRNGIVGDTCTRCGSKV